MGDIDKTAAGQAARRIAEWLARDEENFKRVGVNEGDLADALGLSAEEVTVGIDYLENRPAGGL